MGTEDQPDVVLQPKKSKLHQFFTGPWMGVVGVVGLLLAVYALYDAKETPDLSYYVFTPQPVVATDHISNLSVTFKGKQVAGDVSTALILFWNAGKKPIREADMRDRITVTVGDDLEILEARMGSSRASAKDAEKKAHPKNTQGQIPGGVPTGPASNYSPAVQKVTVDFDVLEKDEWISIFIIYKGKVSETIKATASLIGQKEITRVDNLKDDRGRYVGRTWYQKLFVFAFEKRDSLVAIFFSIVVVASILLAILVDALTRPEVPDSFKASARKIARKLDFIVRATVLLFAVMYFLMFMLVQSLPAFPPDLH